VENPRLIDLFRGHGRNVRVIRYETLSPVTDSPVTCLELTTGFGLRMGWIFLRHHEGCEKYTEITELFVWPTYRRMRLGESLEAAGVDEARLFGSREIRLIMNEADAVSGPPQRAARNFARACGYDLRWRTSVAPRSRATGIKVIEAN
jgi:GNAT superfamily N-acetyltransferase